jgi:hypothetical protein
MQKVQFIDEVYNLEIATHPILTQQMVEIVLNNVYNQLCWDLFLAKIPNYDLCRKRFTDIPVVWDSSADVYYSNYPAAVVPNINEEMIVSTIKGSNLLFYPTTEKTQRRVSNLQSNALNLHIPTILKRERIEYLNMESLSQEQINGGSNPTPKIATVRMDLAIQFKEFASTDVVYTPGGRDYELIQLAVDFITKEPIMEIRNG